MNQFEAHRSDLIRLLVALVLVAGAVVGLLIVRNYVSTSLDGSAFFQIGIITLVVGLGVTIWNDLKTGRLHGGRDMILFAGFLGFAGFGLLKPLENKELALGLFFVLCAMVAVGVAVGHLLLRANFGLRIMNKIDSYNSWERNRTPMR